VGPPRGGAAAVSSRRVRRCGLGRPSSPDPATTGSGSGRRRGTFVGPKPRLDTPASMWSCDDRRATVERCALFGDVGECLGRRLKVDAKVSRVRAFRWGRRDKNRIVDGHRNSGLRGRASLAAARSHVARWRGTAGWMPEGPCCTAKARRMILRPNRKRMYVKQSSQACAGELDGLG